MNLFLLFYLATVRGGTGRFPKPAKALSSIGCVQFRQTAALLTMLKGGMNSLLSLAWALLVFLIFHVEFKADFTQILV